MRPTRSIHAVTAAALLLGGTASAQPDGAQPAPPDDAAAQPGDAPPPTPPPPPLPAQPPEDDGDENGDDLLDGEGPPIEEENGEHENGEHENGEHDNGEHENGDDDLSDMTLEQLLAVEIVTASNMKESLSRAPGVVIRLSREDLEARGYREVTDLFDDLPGMDVIRPWGDNYLKVYWRGYRTDVTHPFLLMIDGMVINSLWTGDASVAAAIPMSEIDHVEIVYGPASATYGANAFMGVVNIITTASLSDDDTGFRLNISTGTYHGKRLDQRIVDGVAVARRGDLRVSVAGRVALDWTDAAAGERFEYTSAAYAGDRSLWGDYLDFDNLARGTKSPINQYGIDARASSGDVEIGVMALNLDTGYGMVYATDAAQPYARWVQYERSAHASYRTELHEKVSSRSLFRLRESGIDNASYFLEGYSGTDIDGNAGRVTDLSYWQARNRSVAFSEDVEADVSAELTLTAGLKYERKDLQGAYDTVFGPALQPGDVDTTNPDFGLPRPPSDDLASVERPLTDDYGVYAQARYRRAGILTPCDAHALHVGVRYDYNSVFGSHHSPTLRVGYVGEQEGKHGLFLGKILYGEGFHEPNPRQLYGGWLGSGSDPSLGPESSRTVEVNASHTIDRWSNLVSAYYVSNVDTITQFEGGAANKGKRTVVGVDYHLRALLRPSGFDSISLWAYYSYIWSEELSFDADDNEVRAPIGDLASHKLWVGGTAKLRERYTATLRSRAVTTRETVATNPIDEIGGYLLFDANVMVERVGGLPMSLALQVDNVIGTHYSHPGIRTADSGETPGRWEGDQWIGSASFYNSRLPQPGRRVMVTLGLDL